MMLARDTTEELVGHDFVMTGDAEYEQAFGGLGDYDRAYDHGCFSCPVDSPRSGEMVCGDKTWHEMDPPWGYPPSVVFDRGRSECWNENGLPPREDFRAVFGLGAEEHGMNPAETERRVGGGFIQAPANGLGVDCLICPKGTLKYGNYVCGGGIAYPGGPRLPPPTSSQLLAKCGGAVRAMTPARCPPGYLWINTVSGGSCSRTIPGPTHGIGTYFTDDQSPGQVRDGIFTTFAGLGGLTASQKKMAIWGSVGAAALLGVGLFYMRRKR